MGGRPHRDRIRIQACDGSKVTSKRDARIRWVGNGVVGVREVHPDGEVDEGGCEVPSLPWVSDSLAIDSPLAKPETEYPRDTNRYNARGEEI